MENKNSSAVQERLNAAIQNIKKAFPQLELRENEPMNGHCSFKIGGPTRALAYPETPEELCELCRILAQQNLKPYLLGNGTNVVFPDAGTELLFVISTEKMQKIVQEENGLICAEAGVPLARLASFAYENARSGLECISGIPGTVGGGTIMNAGAYGGELKDIIASVTVLSLTTLEVQNFPVEKCGFGYRTSFFQTDGGYVVLSAAFNLPVGEKETIASKMKELNQRRRDKQPLNLPSAGSTFRRPEGYFAAALIEECGLKGAAIGGVQVSEKHSGFLVNQGGATEQDLRALIRFVKETVYQQKQVELHEEIILLSPDCSSGI